MRSTVHALLALVAIAGSWAGAVASSEPVDLPPGRPEPLPAGELPVDPADHSVARVWNEVLLVAIRGDSPRPSVHARNLFHLSGSLYDAWAAFHEADTPLLHAEPTMAGGQGAVETAQSYAAYRLLSHRFSASPGHTESQALFDLVMETQGLDPNFTDTGGDTPAALGNRIAASYIDHGLADGANEDGNYTDTVGYNPVNLPMPVWLPGTGGLSDINVWQPLIPPGAAGPQTFLTPHWYGVEPFALEHTDGQDVYHDPGAPPQLGGDGDSELRDHALELIAFGATLDPGDGQSVNISPAVSGNNSLGANDGSGHGVNPATGQPYPDNVVLRGDWSRVLAEFWADGPHSSTPPGHWNEIANSVSDAIARRRIGGEGAAVSALEWDVKLYLALNGALHDAAVAGWEVKYLYESSRPITLIRGMADLGQSSDSSHGSYHPDGLPLEPGLVEIITPDSSAPGERHEHLATHVGEIAIMGWRGHPQDPQADIGGVGWIRAVEWLPYQARNFVTPPFPGYVSGHSTFSRAAAEVLTAFTGDTYFPGGYGEFQVEVGGVFELDFEYGPSQPVALQWATYYDAADEAGLSRVYGGIHPSYDDLPGRIIGSAVGLDAYAQARTLFAPVAGQDPGQGQPVSVPVMSHPGLLLLGGLLLLLGLRASRTVHY